MEIPAKPDGKKKPRGRPRTAENTELIASLIARQDEMARRTAGKIEQILGTHVDLGNAEILWRRICRDARAGLGTLPDRALARIPHLGLAGRAFLEAEIAAILAEMDGGQDDGSPLPTPAPAEEIPTVTRSATLAEARAQLARLQVRLMELKARMGRAHWKPMNRITGEPS